MIMPGEYKARRSELAKRLPKNSIAIIPAASEALRSGDSHYRFRQDSDFYYLTGFNEPDALLLIIAAVKGESYLFNLPHDLIQEQWTGARLGQDGAVEVLGIDGAYPIDSIDIKLPELLAGMEEIYYPIGKYPLWEERIFKAWQVVKGQSRRGIKAPSAFCDLAKFLSECRLFKSDGEIALMQRAASISVLAHEAAMKSVLTANNEYQLEASILYEFYRNGCRDVAYEPIVAGGKNACTLHYIDNNKELNKGDLVLIDAGCESQNYAADISRTFPVNGRFSPEQRAIYELVLTAQKAGIASVRPGCAWDQIQKIIVKIITSGLVDLGLLQGSVDLLIEKEAYKPFYMHNSGHWLGLDVHDCGLYKIDGKSRALESGMVLTVEPGIYISEGIKGVDSRWWGIGVRIEDDIHVTKDGCNNLSKDLAVEIDAIEALIRG